MEQVMQPVEFTHLLDLANSGGVLSKPRAIGRTAYASAASEHCITSSTEDFLGVEFNMGCQPQGYVAVGFVGPSDLEGRHVPGSMSVSLGVNARGEMWATVANSQPVTSKFAAVANSQPEYIGMCKPGDRIAICLVADGVQFVLNDAVVLTKDFIRDFPLHVKVIADNVAGQLHHGRIAVSDVSWIRPPLLMVVSLHCKQTMADQDDRTVVCTSMGGNELATIIAASDWSIDSVANMLSDILSLPERQLRLVSTTAKVFKACEQVAAIA